jgi:DnaJ homolog subfamily C member 25
MICRQLVGSIGLVLATLLSVVIADTADIGEDIVAEITKDGSTINANETSGTPTQTEDSKDKFDVHNEDWGTYYDPKNIFCGDFDCYKILGFDYESFGTVKPTTKEITKRYRRLSRVWHPDKSKHKNAKARFVKIARAYEVLTKFELRNEYDALRYDQLGYLHKYGSSVLWTYAPKTDMVVVILLLLIIANIVSWYSQKHRWQMVANRLIKAAAEDWTPKEGGTPESKQLREDALVVLATREAAEAAALSDDTNGTDTPATVSDTKSKKKKELKKLPNRERKKQEQELLLPIITEFVNAIDDFGGGFHKPTYKDLLIVTMAQFPFKFGKAVIWEIGYWIRRLQKLELNDDERAVLTERAVGITWSVASEEDRQDMVKRQLWIKENFLEWKEEQELKKLSVTEQKMYIKLKKKGKVDKLE